MIPKTMGRGYSLDELCQLIRAFAGYQVSLWGHGKHYTRLRPRTYPMQPGQYARPSPKPQNPTLNMCRVFTKIRQIASSWRNQRLPHLKTAASASTRALIRAAESRLIEGFYKGCEKDSMILIEASRTTIRFIIV